MGSVPLDRIGRCRGTLSGRTRDRQEAQHHLMGQNRQRETDAYFQQAGQERLHEGCAYWCERREFCVINTGTVRASYIYIYIALGWDGLRPVLVGYVFISCYYKLRNHGAQRA